VLTRSQPSGESDSKPTLLLHVCCGPCATAVIERLEATHEITCFFYNPNIHPEAEYGLRLDQARDLARRIGLRFIDGEYDVDEWFRETSGLEDEPEGGRRCGICFRKRLEATARKAKEMGFDAFATTLTVSPHKNAGLIREIGEEVSRRVSVPFFFGDWKKKNGFKRSVELSKQYGLYRQDYCGCEYSR
jgi:predicted adenine nucleotide alpha hydrolase (AANH) superfamily ATPase